MSSRDEQPRIAINYRSNKTKAVHSLLGVISGLVADRRLNEAEVIMLDTWLREQYFLRDDPDVIDIVDLTGDILADGVVTRAELADLKTLLGDILKFRDDGIESDKDIVNHLLGIVRGITADAELNEKEIKAMRSWLKGSYEIKNTWPFNILRTRIDNVLADGVVTDEESSDLLQFLSDMVGGGVADGVVDGMAMTLPLEDLESIDFDGRRFCLTGGFVYGPRKNVAKVISNNGGIVGNKVTLNLDYLVVGSIASTDWAHGSYGRKIETAMNLKDKGQQLHVIGEEVLMSSLNNR